MTDWITVNPSLPIKRWLPQELKPYELASSNALAQRLKEKYHHLRSEQERLRQLNQILQRKGKHPIKLPCHTWTDDHAISLTAKVLPLLLGITAAGILPTRELLVQEEGSPELIAIHIRCHHQEDAQLNVGQPPAFSHRLPLVAALAQLLHHPLRPEIQTALLRRKQLLGIYPRGSLVRDAHMKSLFTQAQLKALEQLNVLVKIGRDYQLK
ncbi:MAG: hypothetical protein HC924_14770 [Synechococcaceae cyanobacterium SM2_3_2]|nr:hypothetical protein [Synechococcaceae cyanobacterium SM2_3_2]